MNIKVRPRFVVEIDPLVSFHEDEALSDVSARAKEDARAMLHGGGHFLLQRAPSGEIEGVQVVGPVGVTIRAEGQG